MRGPVPQCSKRTRQANTNTTAGSHTAAHLSWQQQQKLYKGTGRRPRCTHIHGHQAPGGEGGLCICNMRGTVKEGERVKGGQG